MPRPHRNPQTRAEVEANYAYLLTLRVVPRAERQRLDPDWGMNAAFRLDEGTFQQNLPYTEINWPEIAARVRRRPDDLEPNGRMFRDYRPLDLSKVPDGPKIVRDINLPPFRVDYDSHEQIHQKLVNTVILVKDNPVYVMQSGVQNGKFFLHVRGKGFEGIIPYDEVKDCRGIAPGYFAYRGNAHWVYRSPERQNQQGMHQRNTYHKQAGQDLLNGARQEFLQEVLTFVKDIPFSPNLVEVMQSQGTSSIRLNNNVALYLTNKKGAPCGVEYCGRPLGLIVNDRCKVLDENDLYPTWIAKDLNKVRLELAA